ncbi:MAG: ATP-binding protein [Actinomycetota bacterium]|nr:ATP-binding protein [Actinomycetota bacterium]
MTTTDASLQLQANPASPREARRFLEDTLSAWECDAVSAEVSLLATELVTNALLHARTMMDLRVHRRDRSLRVEVADRSPAMPHVSDLDAIDGDDLLATGRGLTLVTALSSSWGVEPENGGKVVWFEIEA